VQTFLELVAAGALAAKEAPPGEIVRDCPMREEIVIVIDHMNDAPAYMRTLERWASELVCAGLLLYSDAGRRVSGVMLVMQGEAGALTAFLQRLRSEMVDVDAKGRRCKERCSTVLCRRPAGTFKPGYRPAAALTGWRAARYASAEERDALLDDVGMLHVGSGAERFGVGVSAAGGGP